MIIGIFHNILPLNIPKEAVSSLTCFVQEMVKIEGVDAFFMNKVLLMYGKKDPKMSSLLAREFYPDLFTVLDHENLSRTKLL